MHITQIITYIMAVFAAAGVIDRILGDRFGLGSKFDQAFHTMGPLALSMAGMLVIAPVIADILCPVMTPCFRLIGADPAVFAGMFMGTDMGAAPLAEALALDPRSAALSGFVISSMMGATIVFHIPVAMELAKESKPFIARGMIAGLITIPLGCLLGGLAAGFPIRSVIIIREDGGLRFENDTGDIGINPSNATYTSSDESILSFDNTNGTCTFHQTGIVYVTITYQNLISNGQPRSITTTISVKVIDQRKK